MPDFLPRRGADFLSWSRNFDQKINADPYACDLSPEQAAEYSVVHLAFAEAFALVNDNATNSSSAITRKIDAERAARKFARQLARYIRSRIGMTPELLQSLGLRIARPGGQRGRTRARIAAPDHAPQVYLDFPRGNRLPIRLADRTSPTNRGKPRGVAGALVFTFVGENPPRPGEHWRFRSVSRTRYEIDFPATLPPGTKVWIAAQWFNPRGQRGPGSPPVSTHLGLGIALPAMKLAA